VWLQLKRSLNVDGAEVLTDDMREGIYKDATNHCKGYYLDHSLNEEKTPAAVDPNASKVGAKPEQIKLVNHEPLLVNTVNSWRDRPEANVPGVRNFFLASDYVRTNTDLATMEGANEAARRAVNHIIDQSGVEAPPCKVWNLHEPIFFSPFKWLDKRRFKKGLPYKKPPGWFDILMIVWGIIYMIGFFLYPAWTAITTWSFSSKK
jgi:hypothetical protein